MEEMILCTEEGQQLDLPFINKNSYQQMMEEGLQHIHLGLIMVRVQALHRRDAGTNVLIVLRDTMLADDLAVIGTMETDLTFGSQLVYIAPNMMLSIDDFYRHIQLCIHTTTKIDKELKAIWLSPAPLSEDSQTPAKCTEDAGSLDQH